MFVFCMCDIIKYTSFVLRNVVDHLQKGKVNRKKIIINIWVSAVRGGLKPPDEEESRSVAKVRLQKTAPCHKSNITETLSTAKTGARSSGRSLD